MEEEITYDRPIYNIHDEIIENPDLELGYLVEEVLIDVTPAIPPQGHKFPVAMYFDDRTSIINPSADDPHIDTSKADLGQFGYIDQGEGRKLTGMTIGFIIDVPGTPEVKTETPIYRYITYTAEELANRTFLAEGPERLTDAETNVNDLIEIVAELSGSDIEDRVSDQESTIEDMLLLLADLAGGAEEEENVEDSTTEEPVVEDTVVE